MFHNVNTTVNPAVQAWKRAITTAPPIRGRRIRNLSGSAARAWRSTTLRIFTRTISLHTVVDYYQFAR
jgi:hypothetical protein